MSPFFAALLTVGYGLATYLVLKTAQDIWWRHREMNWRRTIFAVKEDKI